MKDKIPGLLLCVLIAGVSKWMGNYFPNIGGASIAIFMGMAVGNIMGNTMESTQGSTMGISQRKSISFKAGARFAESNLLSYSIFLLGGTLSMNTIMKLGAGGVIFIFLQMTFTIIFTVFYGKKLGFTENFSLLMASGNAVCGSSAIAATAPVIGAEEKEKGLAITVVNVTGTVLMLLLPLLAHYLFLSETIKTSALIGGVLQSLGQVVASGSMVGEEVKDLATIFKILRILFLVLVLISFGIFKNKKATFQGNKPKMKIRIPWYVIGFFLMCILFSVGVIPEKLSQWIKGLSNLFEIVALAGIGMSVNFKELVKQGKKISLYALGIASVQVVVALLLIKAISCF